MKKLKIYSLSLILLAGLSLIYTACDNEEFLTENGVQSNSFVAPRNTVDLENLVEGAYYAASGNGGFRGFYCVPHQIFNVASDEGWLVEAEGVSFSTDAVAWYNRNFDTRDSNWIGRAWESGYSTIVTVNQVIDWLEENGAFNDNNGPVWTDRIKGEAHWLRAWANFNLARIYGPPYTDNTLNEKSIILRKKTPAGADDNPPLSTVEEVYDFIVQDLDSAIKLLPEQYVEGRDPEPYKDRVTKYGAHFLAARVKFMMNRFGEAENHASSVINSGLFSLQDDILDPWTHRTLGAKAPETVWQYVAYNGQQRWKPPVIHRWFGYYDGNGNPDGTPNGAQQLALSDAFLQQTGWEDTVAAKMDKRYNELYVKTDPNEDPRPGYSSISETKIWPNKWYRSEYSGWGTASTTSVPFMRLSEMYLTRAYLRLKDGDSQGAADDLNEVRERAWAGDPGDFEAITAGAITEEDIETERMRELAFEDDRVYYLQSLRRDLPVGDRTGAQPYPFEETGIPIPQDEIDRNPNISAED